jgi:hypothetical protein
VLPHQFLKRSSRRKSFNGEKASKALDQNERQLKAIREAIGKKSSLTSDFAHHQLPKFVPYSFPAVLIGVIKLQGKGWEGDQARRWTDMRRNYQVPYVALIYKLDVNRPKSNIQTSSQVIGNV